MNTERLTLAIHSSEKAKILKDVLLAHGIAVFLEQLNNLDSHSGDPDRYYVKIRACDLTDALAIIEENRLFNYKDQRTITIDDRRKRILVAVDFSDYSLKACQVAFSIAQEINAKVKILHVYHNIYFPSHIPFADELKDNSDDGLLNKSRKNMLDLCIEIDKKIANKEWSSVNYSYSLREGIVDEEIELFIEEYKPILLVLGTKGRDNNQTSILGNVTADVIEIVNTPVLAISQNSPINSISDIKHIAFLTSLQSQDINSFNTLVNNFMPKQNIKVSLLHLHIHDKEINKWNDNELQSVSEYLKKAYPQINISYKLINVPDISYINEYIEKENITVICLTTRKRNLLQRIFAPSFSRKMLVESDKTLLVLRG